MIRSLYSGVSGMRNQQICMDVIGNNISNASTYGFKAGRACFKDLFSQQLKYPSGTDTPPYVYSSQVGTGVTIGSVQNLFDQGGLQVTDRALDLAIQGNGFFMLKDSTSNKIYYTRDGNFTLDKEGYLTSVDGLRVLDSSGAEIPALTSGQQITGIGVNGEISVLNFDGTTGTLGIIGIANIINPDSLEKCGNNNYIPTITTGSFSNFSTPINPGAPGGTGGQGIIQSGYLEMSNVDLTNEFARLITTQRSYQANARVITTSDEMLQNVIDLKR